MTHEQERLNEPFVLTDIYASGLGAVEVIGDGNVRFVFYVERPEGRDKVAHIVCPITAIPAGLALAAQAAGTGIPDAICKLCREMGTQH